MTHVVFEPETPASCDLLNVTLTPLQELIHEVLDPLALPKRRTKEWRRLHRSFFAFFAPEGPADEAERKAWAAAFEALNRNLVAVRNRTAQVVPMTYQDCVEAIDSFRHDGLFESAQRDIAWQPKKLLLLMSAMIGRVVAGQQADLLLPAGDRGQLHPFKEYLIEENRKAGFLGHLFNYDAQFSILEYQAVGLRPLVYAFPHCAYALIENGPYRCEVIASPVLTNPPLLRLHFRRPLREPISLRTMPSLDIILLRDPLPATAKGYNAPLDNDLLENSRSALASLAFDAADAPEVKQSIIERLFELAIRNQWLICSTHRATALSAGQLATVLGRTRAEQFAIEQFFSLGFRSGCGNEPWREQVGVVQPEISPEKVKEAQRQFEHWRSALLFFSEAGHPEAAGLAGARLRQETLQAKGNGASAYLTLLRTPAYGPLMEVFLAVDSQGRWLVSDPDLHIFARALSGGTGTTLFKGGGIVAEQVDALAHKELKALFLFECALGIFLGIPDAQQSQFRGTKIEEVRNFLRQRYEQQFDMILASAPSAWWENVEERDLQMLSARKRIEAAEQKLGSLVEKSLSAKVGAALEETLAVLRSERGFMLRRLVPRVRLENQTAFEQSMAELSTLIRGLGDHSLDAPCSGPDQLAPALADARLLAEAGHAVPALEKAASVAPALSRKKRERLLPFFTELTTLVLGDLEAQLSRGQDKTTTDLVEKGRLLLAGTPALAEFNALLQELSRSKPGLKRPAPAAASPTVAAGRPATDPRVQQAQVLLQDFGDELALGENSLEQEFLQAVVAGSVGGFKRKAKLENRLQKLTQWGGREPHMTTLRLLKGY